MPTTTTTPVAIKEVLVSRCEGRPFECKSVACTSISDANKVLQTWAHTAPQDRTYHKCDITFRWEDGKDFYMRYELRGGMHFQPLADALNRYLTFHSGRHTCENPETYQTYLNIIWTYSPKEYFEDMLDNYTIA